VVGLLSASDEGGERIEFSKRFFVSISGESLKKSTGIVNSNENVQNLT